jgi:hypothetical protein
MSTISTDTRTLSQSPEDRRRQIAQVQMVVAQVANDPDAMMLARLQHILNLSDKDPVVRQHLHDAITRLNQQARELGHRVIE